MEKTKWLPHLEKSIPKEVKKYTLSLYSIALEGWRRGLTLKFTNHNKRNIGNTIYSLSDNEKEHQFLVSKGDLVEKSAMKICGNKHMTKSYLLKANVPTPEGKKFGKDQNDQEIINFANELGYPLVIKPTNGASGHGVIANIKNGKDFREALSYVKYELRYSEIIVEKFFHGDDYRVYVIDNNVCGAIHRISANVIGDGTNPVRELINIKIKERANNPALSGSIIKVDKEMHNMLSSIGYTLESVPKEGERVFLKSKNNISAGGDPIDVTDKLTNEDKDIAIRAIKAIPGLIQGGVDIMVNRDENTCVVLEVNSIPSIRTHLFPIEGQARDIPKAIIDYYFPETISNHNKPSFYFDFQSIIKSFQNGDVEEFTVPDIPKGNLSSTRFIVAGEMEDINYDEWVKRKARELNLHGYIKHINEGKVSIVVSGTINSIKKFKDNINSKSTKKAKIRNVIEKSRNSPVKIGFEIINPNFKKCQNKNEFPKKPDLSTDGYYPIHLKDYFSKKNNKAKKGKSRVKVTSDYTSILKERDFYKEKYNDIKNSRTWKIMKPVRKVSRIIKKSVLNK